MNKENLSKLLSIEAKINIDGSFDIPNNLLKDLANNGFSNVIVEVFGDAKHAASHANIDIGLFERIKYEQDIPETVVFDFLSSKGKMSSSDFDKRITK